MARSCFSASSCSCPLPSPVGQLCKLIASHVHNVQWIDVETPAPDADLENIADFRAAADWISKNTPETDIVIAPPWRADAYYFLRRPLIADWHAFRYDDMPGWRARIEAMVGDLSNTDPNDPQVGDMDLHAREHFRHLTTADISGLQQKIWRELADHNDNLSIPAPILFRSLQCVQAAWNAVACSLIILPRVIAFAMRSRGDDL